MGAESVEIRLRPLEGEEQADLEIVAGSLWAAIDEHLRRCLEADGGPEVREVLDGYLGEVPLEEGFRRIQAVPSAVTFLFPDQAGRCPRSAALSAWWVRLVVAAHRDALDSPLAPLGYALETPSASVDDLLTAADRPLFLRAAGRFWLIEGRKPALVLVADDARLPVDEALTARVHRVAVGEQWEEPVGALLWLGTAQARERTQERAEGLLAEVRRTRSAPRGSRAPGTRGFEARMNRDLAQRMLEERRAGSHDPQVAAEVARLEEIVADCERDLGSHAPGRGEIGVDPTPRPRVTVADLVVGPSPRGPRAPRRPGLGWGAILGLAVLAGLIVGLGSYGFIAQFERSGGLLGQIADLSRGHDEDNCLALGFIGAAVTVPLLTAWRHRHPRWRWAARWFVAVIALAAGVVGGWLVLGAGG